MGRLVKPWMAAGGKLRRLHKERVRIDRRIEEEFEQVDAEDRLRFWIPTDFLLWWREMLPSNPFSAKRLRSPFQPLSLANATTAFGTLAVPSR
jgi:hypothetical protein